eukprot:10081035-Karenia_brevis.AAC.1
MGKGGQKGYWAHQSHNMGGPYQNYQQPFYRGSGYGQGYSGSRNSGSSGFGSGIFNTAGQYNNLMADLTAL